MFYLAFGNSNKAIIFLHGWGASHKSFFWCNDYISNDFLKIYVDFKGFGYSSCPSKSYSLVDYANDVKEILDKFSIEELIVVGHSFGGRVAIKFAHLYGSNYKKLKLVLVDSAGLKPRRNLIFYFKIFRYKFLKRLSQKNAKYLKLLSNFGSNDYKLLSNSIKPVFVRIVNEDLKSIIKTLHFETIIIWGRDDKETKPYMARMLKKLIRGSKLFFIENAGHFCFLDNPREFLIILDTFIKNK